MSAELENLIGDSSQSPSFAPAIHSARKETKQISVGREGVQVKLTIGNSSMWFDWKTAMTLGQWLLAKGSEAKLLDGDTNRLVVELAKGK